MGAVISFFWSATINYLCPPRFEHFMEFPPEIRIKILTFALPTSQWLFLGPGPYFSHLENDRLLTRIPPLCQVSRQLRAETIPIFFGNNLFYIGLGNKNWNWLVDWLGLAFDDHKASFIKELYFLEHEIETVGVMFPGLTWQRWHEKLLWPDPDEGVDCGPDSKYDQRVDWKLMKRVVWDDINAVQRTIDPENRGGDSGLRKYHIARMMLLLGRGLCVHDTSESSLLAELCKSDEPELFVLNRKWKTREWND